MHFPDVKQNQTKILVLRNLDLSNKIKCTKKDKTISNRKLKIDKKKRIFSCYGIMIVSKHNDGRYKSEFTGL